MTDVFFIPLGLTLGNTDTSGHRKANGTACLPEFIADPENALLAAVTNPSQILQHDFNPLVLTGPTGVGKTFLASGIAARWSQEHPCTNVVSHTGADFARLLAEAIDAGGMDDFRTVLRNADILLLDDVTELDRKDAAQAELARTIDHLRTEQKLVVVTSRITPSRLTRFSPQLKSRLCEGLVLPLKPPGPAARREIVMRLAERQSLELSEEATTYLAADGPPLVSALNGLLLQIKSSNPTEPASASCVRSILEERYAADEPSINSLAKLVAKRFRLKVADLKGSSRRRQTVRARGAAMFLARKHTGLSLERVGEFFGKRDHSTVLHACQRTAERITCEPDLKEAINDITNQLRERLPA